MVSPVPQRMAFENDEGWAGSGNCSGPQSNAISVYRAVFLLRFASKNLVKKLINSWLRMIFKSVMQAAPCKDAVKQCARRR